MKEIRNRLTGFVIISTLAGILITGILSMFIANKIIGSSSDKRLQMQCESEGHNFNDIMNSVKSSEVFLHELMCDYAKDPEALAVSADNVMSFETKISGIMKRLGDNTEGCTAVYFRFAPEYTDFSKGKFFIIDKTTRKMVQQQTTDSKSYAANDLTNAQWYHEPIKAGKAIWMGPYYNKHAARYIMSYASPVYVDEILVGVVGMDVDFSYIMNYVNEAKIYSTGKEQIACDGSILEYNGDKLVSVPVKGTDLDKELYGALHSQGESMGHYHEDGKQMMFASSDIDGGLKLVISAPTSEIYKDSYTLGIVIIFQIVFFAAIVLILSDKIGTWMIKRAYSDRLTNLPNREYFQEQFIKELKEDNGQHRSLFMLDIDHFKRVNDTYGHAKGDEVLNAVAEEMRAQFGKDAVLARWGGDEFIGLIGADGSVRRCKDLCRSTAEDSTEVCSGGYTLSIGIYNIPVNDRNDSLEEMLNKADKALYEAKTIRNCVMIYSQMGETLRQESEENSQNSAAQSE